MRHKIVSVIWEDHMRVDRQELITNPENLIVTTITTGILIKKTKKALIIASEIERYDDRDDLTYTIILRPTVQGIKEFGEIEIDNLRIAP